MKKGHYTCAIYHKHFNHYGPLKKHYAACERERAEIKAHMGAKS